VATGLGFATRPRYSIIWNGWEFSSHSATPVVTLLRHSTHAALRFGFHTGGLQSVVYNMYYVYWDIVTKHTVSLFSCRVYDSWTTWSVSMEFCWLINSKYKWKAIQIMYTHFFSFTWCTWSVNLNLCIILCCFPLVVKVKLNYLNSEDYVHFGSEHHISIWDLTERAASVHAWSV